MAKNTDLRKAFKAKKDEFYTQLTDIEKEMRYYKEHFKGKTIFNGSKGNYRKHNQFECIAWCGGKFTGNRSRKIRSDR